MAHATHTPTGQALSSRQYEKPHAVAKRMWDNGHYSIPIVTGEITDFALALLERIEQLAVKIAYDCSRDDNINRTQYLASAIAEIREELLRDDPSRRF